MGSDHFLRYCDISYPELQRGYNSRGFTGMSHEMIALCYCQSWRLMEGAEPSKWLSYGPPAVHMRYGPYTQPKDL